MEEENKIEANTLASSDKRKEILISLNTNENQEEIKMRIIGLIDRLNILDSNHFKILENFEILREAHFCIYEEYSKLKSQNALLNPDKKTIMSQNDKNIKSDRNIHKLHSTVKKKEININNLNRLDSLSVSSAKNTKSLKSDISVTPLTRKNNRPDSHSVKGPELRSKFIKKEMKEKDPKETHLQTETDAQVSKTKTKHPYLSPSKSLNKSPILKEEGEKHKKTISDFKKNSNNKEVLKKNVEKEKEKDQKKVKEHNDNKIPKEKNTEKSVNKNNKHNEKPKTGEVKQDKNAVNKKQVVSLEKMKEEDKPVETLPALDLNGEAKEYIEKNETKGKEDDENNATSTVTNNITENIQVESNILEPDKV